MSVRHLPPPTHNYALSVATPKTMALAEPSRPTITRQAASIFSTQTIGVSQEQFAFMKHRIIVYHTSGDFGKQRITLSPIAFTILATLHSGQAQFAIIIYEK